MGVYARWDTEKKQWKLVFSCDNLLRKYVGKCRLCIKAKKRRKSKRKDIIIMSTHFLFPETIVKDFVPWDFLEFFLRENPEVVCEVPVIGAEKIIILTDKHNVEDRKVLNILTRSGIKSFVHESNKLIKENYGLILGGFQLSKNVPKQWQHPHIYLIAFPNSFLPGGFENILRRFLSYANNFQKKPYYVTKSEDGSQLYLLNLSMAGEKRSMKEIIEAELKDLTEKIIILIRLARIKNMLGIIIKSGNSNRLWPLRILSILGISYECELDAD